MQVTLTSARAKVLQSLRVCHVKADIVEMGWSGVLSAPKVGTGRFRCGWVDLQVPSGRVVRKVFTLDEDGGWRIA